MKAAWATLALLPALYAGQAKHIASYDIQARLDTLTKIITGSETLTWVNDSPDVVSTLQFHLYMNAFKNEKSTFMRESGGQLRGDRFEKKEWGWINVKRMRLKDGADLTKAIRFIHPDDDNADDQTVIEVALPAPVKPGGQAEVLIDFETKLPQVFARTGFHGTFYLVGQWFPKVGVYERAGMRYAKTGGWNCHQFHAHSEFYANFGRYRVELTVPQTMVIGATGEMKEKRADAAAKTATYRFEQEDVTDFVWTVQPNYRREERMFVADRETTPRELAEVAKRHAVPESEARLSDVKVIVLAQPEHRRQVDRYFRSAMAGIKWFGLWYGRYPYQTLTVVDPPAGGMGAGGMEYPTFITGGTFYGSPEDVMSPEEVTVHEFGHQFWKELIATNEFEESWLDEGFNTYSTSKIIQKVYGRWSGTLPVFGFNLWRVLRLPSISDFEINRASNVGSATLDSLQRFSWQYLNSGSYGVNSYPRTAVALMTLEGVLGSDLMERVMRTYHQRWRFGHPSTLDFRKVAEEVSGRDLGWFFDQFVFGARLLDYKVLSAVSQRVREPIGVFDKGNGFITVTREEAEKRDGSAKRKMWETTVKIRREGDAIVPVDVLVRFKDGTTERRSWDGVYRWTKFTFLKPSEVASVELDPEHRLQLDVSRANNSYTVELQKKLDLRWGGNLLYWVQNALLWAGALV